MLIKTFMKEIVDSFIISQDKVQIGVAQYSDDPQKEFYLNEFFTNSAIKGKIDSIVQLQGSTFTGKGLSFVTRFFEASNGSRKNKGVLQLLIVITDGESDDAVDEAAISLRNSGIQIFAIGIGIHNSFELIRITGSAERVHTVANFEELKTIEKKIVTDICEPGDVPIQGKSIYTMTISSLYPNFLFIFPFSSHLSLKVTRWPTLKHTGHNLTNFSLQCNSKVWEKNSLTLWSLQ